MNIKYMSKDLSKVEIYQMTKSPSITSMKEVEDGTILHIVARLDYDDDDKNITSVMDDTGHCYGFQSKTFADSLADIAEIFDGVYEFPIRKFSGVSKSGRDYINCELAVEELRGVPTGNQ